MTLVLTHSHIATLIDRTSVYDAVEHAHADLVTGTATNPAPPVLALERGGAVLPMVATSARHRVSSVKMLSDMPFNRDVGLATQRSTIMLMSADTGECEAILDGRLITAIRTAAASALRQIDTPEAAGVLQEASTSGARGVRSAARQQLARGKAPA